MAEVVTPAAQALLLRTANPTVIYGSLTLTGIASLLLRTTGPGVLFTGVVHVSGAIVLEDITIAGSIFLPQLGGSTAWLAAAAHGATLSHESGEYSPVVLIDFLDYDLTIGSHDVPFPTSTNFLKDLSKLLDGGIGTITRELDEAADVIRLGGTSLTLLYTDELRTIFAARPLPLSKVRIRLGFEELTEASDYTTIFSGVVDRVTRTIETFTLSLIDDSVAQDRNLSVPLAKPLFPQAPSESQSLHIPIIIGQVRGMVLHQVAGGPAAGTLAFAMDGFQQELWMPETEVLWPRSGSITVGAEAMTFETHRIEPVDGIPYRNLQGLVRNAPSPHAATTAVTLTSTDATFPLGFGVHTLNAVYQNGTPLDAGDIDISSVEVLGRTVPLLIVQVALDEDDIISADVNAESPILVPVPWVEDYPDPPPGTPAYDEYSYLSSFGAGGVVGGSSNATITEEHSLDSMTWTFTHPPDPPIDHVVDQQLGFPGAGYLLQVLANAPDVWGEAYQQSIGLTVGARYEFTMLYRNARDPFGTSDNHSDAVMALGTAANPSLYHTATLQTGAMLSGAYWNSYYGQFTASTNSLRWTVRTKYVDTEIPSWFMGLGLRRLASPLDDPDGTGDVPVVPRLTAEGVNPVLAILFMISMFYPDATYNRQAFLTAQARLEQAPPWRFRGLLTNPGSANTLLQRMAQQCQCLLWLNAENRYDIMFLDDSRETVMDFGADWNIIQGFFTQENTPPDSIYTSIYLYFDTDQGGSTTIADYRKIVYVTPTEGSSYGDASALIAVMAATFAWTQRDNQLTFFADFIDDIYTAGQLLAWLVARYGGEKDILTFETYIDAVALRLGQVVRVEHPVLGEAEDAIEGEVVRWEYDPGETTVQLTTRVLGLAPPTEGEDEVHITGAITLDDVLWNAAPVGFVAALGQAIDIFSGLSNAFEGHVFAKPPTTAWRELVNPPDNETVFGTIVVDSQGSLIAGVLPRTIDWQEDPLNTPVPALLYDVTADGPITDPVFPEDYGFFASAFFTVTDMAYFGSMPRRTPYLLGLQTSTINVYGSAYLDIPAQVGASYALSFYYKNLLYPFGSDPDDHSDAAFQIGTPGNPTLYADVALDTGAMGDGTSWDTYTETYTATATTTRITLRSVYVTHALPSYFHHLLLRRETLPVSPPVLDDGSDAGYLDGGWTAVGAAAIEYVAEVEDDFTEEDTTITITSTPIASRQSPRLVAVPPPEDPITTVRTWDGATQLSALGEFEGRVYAALEASALYATTQLSLWVSADGVTWSFLRASITDFPDVNKITAFCTFQNAFWAAACHTGTGYCAVYRSEDGETWTEEETFSVTDGRTYALATDGSTLWLSLGVEGLAWTTPRPEVWAYDGATWTLEIDLGTLPDATLFPCATALHYSGNQGLLMAGVSDPQLTQAGEIARNIRFYQRTPEGAWSLNEEFDDLDTDIPVVFQLIGATIPP